uniref:DNA replication ATP-dependent helicase/nuclease DNA2 n=1 Tax=Meloidogyne hapla TaxID=6305 RepID=A0A1I8BE57_MELHA
MNNKNDSFEEFWQGIDIIKQKQSPITLIKRPKIGVQQQLFKWLKPNENKINANESSSTSPTFKKPLISVSSPSSICSCSSTSNLSPPSKKSRQFKRRHHQQLVEFQSGVKGFPSLINNNKHLLVYVIDVNKGIDDCGNSFINLKCELATQSISSKRHKVNVYLRDSWAVETPELCVRQLVRLIEPNKIDENTFEIFDSSDDDQNSCGGLLIIEPETLISSTQLAQAHYCPRKAMFQDRFRTTDTTIAMTVGTIAHELFQIALDLLPLELSSDWLFKFYRKYFLSKICPDLVGMDCSLEKFEEELRLYLENISDWIKLHHPHYKNEKENNQPIAQIRQQNNENDENNDPNLPNEPFFYSKTVDIEENIWTPTIGFKGRIDVSFMGGKNLSLCLDSNKSPLLINEQSQLVLPLELKTGKSYGSIGCVEHQTQVMLYSLMLSERANNGRLSLGFLLYLRDNKIASIHPKAVQLRGIIQMRNRLASHFSKFTIDSFPDPLRNPRSCINCPYATLCSTIALGNEISAKEEESSKNKVEIQKSRSKKFISSKNNNEDLIVIDEKIKQNGKENVARLNGINFKFFFPTSKQNI